MSKHYWRNGAPTEAAIDAFTLGDCWILALELGRQGDLPVYLIDDGTHYVVRYDTKRFLDIQGLATRPQLLERWGATSLRKIRPEIEDELRMVFTLASVFPGSHRRAKPMAQRLLAWAEGQS